MRGRTSISNAAPQFLVRHLSEALAFYEQRLGFRCDFVYEDFYAGVSRGGAIIHLKGAPGLQEERAHRKAGKHLDAYLAVSGIDDLHDELVGRGAPIAKALEERPWGTRDFHVEDPFGYILCFSEATEPSGAVEERAVAVIPADDLALAKAFYVDRLGFEVQWEDTADGKQGVMGVARGGIELTIDCPMSGHGRDVCVSLRVNDADSYYREWRDSVEIAHPPQDELWSARTFGFTDPSGNTIFVIGPAT